MRTSLSMAFPGWLGQQRGPHRIRHESNLKHSPYQQPLLKHALPESGLDSIMWWVAAGCSAAHTILILELVSTALQSPAMFVISIEKGTRSQHAQTSATSSMRATCSMSATGYVNATYPSASCCHPRFPQFSATSSTCAIYRGDATNNLLSVTLFILPILLALQVTLLQ